MKKIWVMGALIACLSGSAVMAANVADFTNNSQYAMVQGARKNDRGTFQNALYLDMNSIHVADVADDGMIVTADVVEVPEKGSVTKHSTKYKLAADGSESILGLDGNWYVLPENSDDPAAVAAMKVRDELGNGEKREQFVTEIQHILLKKQGAGMESEPKAEGNPAPAAETSVTTDAAASQPENGTGEESPVPAGQTAEEGNLPPDAADAYAKSSAVRAESKPSDEGAASASDTASAKSDEAGQAKEGNPPEEPTANTPAPKDSEPTESKPAPADPPVVVQIESHQPPQVKVEIKGHGE